MVVIAILYGVYGVVKISTHSKRVNDITELYQSNPGEAVEQEYDRAKKEISGYNSVIKRTWPVIMVLGLLLFLFVTKDFVSGIGLGLMVFSLFAIIGDLALQTRLEDYLLEIQSFI